MSRIVDSLIAYRILRMFSQPIKKHPAYLMGIVDADGNKLKEPSGSQELDAYTLLDKLAFKIKRALMKSPDRTAKRLLTFAAAIAILRENKDVEEENEHRNILYHVQIEVHSAMKVTGCTSQVYHHMIHWHQCRNR